MGRDATYGGTRNSIIYCFDNTSTEVQTLSGVPPRLLSSFRIGVHLRQSSCVARSLVDLESELVDQFVHVLDLAAEHVQVATQPEGADATSRPVRRESLVNIAHGHVLFGLDGWMRWQHIFCFLLRDRGYL